MENNVRVTYNVRDNNGYLQERKIRFDNIRDAVMFVRSNTNIVGKPVVEDE